MVSPGTILVSPPVPVQGITHITAIVGYLGQRYSYQDWLLGQSLLVPRCTSENSLV